MYNKTMRDILDYLTEIQTLALSSAIVLQMLAEHQTDMLLRAQLLTLKAASELNSDKAATLKDILPERSLS